MTARPASAKTMQRRYLQFGRELRRAEQRTANLIHIIASTDPERALCSRYAAKMFVCPEVECAEHAPLATCPECLAICGRR